MSARVDAVTAVGLATRQQPTTVKLHFMVVFGSGRGQGFARDALLLLQSVGKVADQPRAGLADLVQLVFGREVERPSCVIESRPDFNLFKREIGVGNLLDDERVYAAVRSC